VATPVAVNTNEIKVTPVVGSDGVSVWQKPGVRRSVLCRGVRQERGSIRLGDVYTFNLVHKDFLKMLCFLCDLQTKTAVIILLLSTRKFHSRELWRVILQ
jgi:hypothetical protein